MAEKLEIVIWGKDKFSGTFSKLKSHLPSMKAMVVGTTAAVAGLSAAMYAMTKGTAESYDKVQKLSDQLGVSTEFLSKMQVAAEFSGVAVGTLNKSTAMLQVRIGEAARGIGEGKDAFESLGVALKDTSGRMKTAEQIMPELADAFHNVSNATERAEIASKIFGQRGMAMLQMFKEGKDGLEAMTDEAERFGLVVSAKAGANAAEFNDSLTRMQGAFKGVKNAIAEKLMPTLSGLQNRFANFIAENREKMVEFAETFLISMAHMAEKGAYAVAFLVDSWRGLQMTWEILKITFYDLSSAIWKGLDWITQKLVTFMETFNFRGMFDDAIEGAQRFAESSQGVIEEMTELGEAGRANLDALIDEEMMMTKVDNIVEKIRTSIEEITEEGDVWKDDQLDKQETFEKSNLAILDKYTKKRQKMKKAEDAMTIKTDKMAGTNKQAFYAMLQDMGKTHGGAMLGMIKISSIVETIASTNKAAAGAYAALAWIPLVGPALGTAAAWAAMAFGMMRVNEIRRQPTSVAHGGLTSSPKEQTYLIDKGERILSPNQNRDFTDFVKGGGGGVTIESLSIHVLENATNASALLEMDKRDWEEICHDQIVPAFQVLAKQGVTV